jgi:hypothetical protein
MNPVGGIVALFITTASFVLLIYWLAQLWMLIRHPEKYEAVQT